MRTTKGGRCPSLRKSTQAKQNHMVIPWWRKEDEGETQPRKAQTTGGNCCHLSVIYLKMMHLGKAQLLGGRNKMWGLPRRGRPLGKSLHGISCPWLLTATLSVSWLLWGGQLHSATPSPLDTCLTTGWQQWNQLNRDWNLWNQELK